MTSPAESRPLRPARVLLPTQHGSWGFVLEPVALGLLAVPSWAGAALGAAALLAFLAHRPFEARRLDRRRGVHDRRTRLAEAAWITFAAAALACLVVSLRSAGPVPLLPLALAAPLGAIFLAFAARGQGRSLTAELAGPAAFAAIAAAIPLAGGWDRAAALALWMAMAARAAPAVLYVRSRLRLERGQPHHPSAVVGAHAAALAVVGILVTRHLLPALALVAFALLLIRSAVGLSPIRRQLTPQRVGLRDTLYGALTVLLVGVGYRL